MYAPSNVVQHVQDSYIPRSRKTLTILEVEGIDSRQFDDQYGIFDQSLNKLLPENTEKAEQGSLMLINGPVTIKSIKSKVETSFAQKQINFQGNNPDFLKQLRIGVECQKGLKPEVPNQDDFCIMVDKGFILLTIVDGHGPFGHQVANYVHTMLPKQIIQYPDFQNNCKSALKWSFVQTHKGLILNCEHPNSSFDCIISGTTALTCLIMERTLWIAHVGDTRGMVIQQNSLGLSYKILTKDHRPQDNKEQARLISKNAQVRQENYSSMYRVYVSGKNYPGLSITRCLGNLIAQNIGVVPTPTVNRYTIEDQDKFIVIASDGVWTFMTEDDICSIFDLNLTVQQNCVNIAARAREKWLENDPNVVDDITVMIMNLELVT